MSDFNIFMQMMRRTAKDRRAAGLEEADAEGKGAEEDDLPEEAAASSESKK